MIEESCPSETCQQFEAELPSYLEGENHPFVVAHAKECSFCHPILADLELIRQASQQLPSDEIDGFDELPATVWANVRAALAAEGIIHEPVSAWRLWLESFGFGASLAPVAAVAGLVIVASFLMVPPSAVNTTDRFNAGLRASGVATPALESSEFRQERSLALAVGEVETAFSVREPALRPGVKDAYRKSLKSLDNSIRECQDSIRREPHNRLAHEYLQRAYTQKAEVLTAALEYDADNPR